MVRRLGLCARAFVLAAGAFAAGAPAAVGAEGKQSFRGTIGTTGLTGTRHVVATVVVAKGVYNGAGKVVEVPNRPGDPDRVSRDNLVFPKARCISRA